MYDIQGRPMLTTPQAARMAGGTVLPDYYVRFGPTRAARPTCDMCGAFASRELRWMTVAGEWRCRACDEEN